MTRYLLDTNIVNDVINPQPSETLLDWLSHQLDTDLYIASWIIGEIQRGIFQMPARRKRRHLEDWFDGPEGPPALFRGRILAFDEAAALLWARLMADGTRIGKPRSALDMIIAATAQANDCAVVSLNSRNFSGAVDVFNPTE